MTDVPADPRLGPHAGPGTGAAGARGTEGTASLSTWVHRVWPGPADGRAPGRTLAAAVLAGVLAASVLVTDHVGVNVLATGLAVTAVAALPLWRRRPRGAALAHVAAFGVLALALLSVVAVRDAEWVAALCLLLALPVASYALTGGGTWREVLLGGLTVPAAAGLRMLPWAGRGAARAVRVEPGRAGALLRGLLATVALLLVFGALFASADAAFGSLVGRLVPDVSADLLPARVLLLGATAALALAAAYTAASPPRWDRIVPPPARPAGRVEWLVPLLLLDALFLAFTVVQATVLLAGDGGALLAGTGLTYAEYAREGFAQLVVVTALVLGVLAVAVRRAPRESVRDRLLVRLVLGLLCLLTLVVVASALRRLGLYEEAYGLTRLRLWVHAFELWLGLLVVLAAVAGLVRRGRWLPRAVAATGAAGLLALAALSPDAVVARDQADRLARTGAVDVAYLSGLSADAVPALDALPEPYRSCALAPIAARLETPGPWYAANAGRARARALLDARPPTRAGPACAAVRSRG